MIELMMNGIECVKALRGRGRKKMGKKKGEKAPDFIRQLYRLWAAPEQGTGYSMRFVTTSQRHRHGEWKIRNRRGGRKKRGASRQCCAAAQLFLTLAHVERGKGERRKGKKRKTHCVCIDDDAGVRASIQGPEGQRGRRKEGRKGRKEGRKEP